MCSDFFPSLSPSNHKQPKAGNRRAGKEGDTARQTQERQTQERNRILTAGTWKTLLTCSTSNLCWIMN